MLEFQIDWSFQHEFFDKELQAIAKDALVGMRHVDKLAKVRRLSGEEDRLCIHLEVQVSRQAQFAERVFIYHYRIFDIYHKLAVSMALLGDDSLTWLPQKYFHTVMGCKLELNNNKIKPTTQPTRQGHRAYRLLMPYGTIAVTSISTRARSSISPATCTAVMVG